MYICILFFPFLTFQNAVWFPLFLLASHRIFMVRSALYKRVFLSSVEILVKVLNDFLSSLQSD